jgi:hypothetical protein
MNLSINFQQDPVYMQADGQFCFYSIDGSGFFGPYPDETTARRTLGDYITWLNQQAQPPAQPQQDTSAIERATAEYMALRDQKGDINERYKAELAEVDAQMVQVEGTLLHFLNTSGLKNFSTEYGLVYTEAVYQPQLGDKGAFLDFVRAKAMPELLQARVSQTALRQYVEAGNPMPPGVTVNQERVVRVRSK